MSNKFFDFFKNFNKNLLVAPILKPQGDIESYITALESGFFKDKFFYGISQKERGFITLNPFTDPGALYVGKMGSGKSIGMKTTVLTHLLANSENTIYIIYDDVKGAGDYKIFFGLKDNVTYAIMDKDKIVPLIEMLFSEMDMRKFEFSKMNNASGVPEYEQFAKQKDPNHKGVARIVLAIEEFHSISSNDKIKFTFKADVEGTVANKLKQLMRLGRSYGIFVLAATQRANSEDFPSTLRPGISMMLAFRVSTANDVSFMGSDMATAADLPPYPGRCLAVAGGFSYGETQFPFIPDAACERLIQRYVKPFNAKLFRYQLSDYQTAFSGKGNDGMVEILDFKTVFLNYEQYNFNKITEKYLNAFDFKLTPQENPLYIANFIAERDGEYYAVMSMGSNKEGNIDKMLSKLQEYLPVLSQNLNLKINKIIAIFAEQGTTQKGKLPEGSIVLEKFELKHIAEFLDTQRFMDKDQYDLVYSKMPLAKRDNNKLSSEEERKRDMLEADKLIQAINSQKSSLFDNDDGDDE